ncbi:MAG: hypothetical protein ACRDKT_15005 [Actinomycetota bacterium]
MSTTIAQLDRSVEKPTVVRPRRRTVATHHKFPDARRTVDRLSEAGLPVGDRAIIARDIRLIERGSRRKIGSMMVDGGVIGAFVAAIVALLLGSFTMVRPLASTVLIGFWSLTFGAVVGAVVAVVRNELSITRPSRGRAIVAESFDVVVDVDIADRASGVLRQREAIVIGPPRTESATDRPLGSPAR